MKKDVVLCALVLVATLLVAPSFAADMGGEESQTMQTQQTLPSSQQGTRQYQGGQQGELQNALLISELMNKKVRSMQDENLGIIQNLVVDPTGRISYILLEPAQGIKEEGQLVAILWNAAFPNMQANQVVLLLSKNQLENAPSISKDNLAQLQNLQWQQSNFAYFGLSGMQPGYGYGCGMQPGCGEQPGYGTQTQQGSGSAPEDYGGMQGYGY